MMLQQMMRKKVQYLRALCIISFLERKPFDKKRLPERPENYNKQAVYIRRFYSLDSHHKLLGDMLYCILLLV